MDKNLTFLQIPNSILENRELDGDNKILLSKIIELHKRAGSCFASNNTFGNLIGMSRTSVSKRITKLKQLGYVTTEDVWEGNVQKGRIITPTYKKGSSQKKQVRSSKSSKGIVPEVKGGSSPSSKVVVPEVGTNTQPLIYKETDKHIGAGMSMFEFYNNKQK
jgi:biotin operon repressor